MHVVRDYQLQEVPDEDEYDLALEHTSRLYGSHTNNIPVASGVQTARLFYGGRFDNQYTAQANGEAPLVQNLDDSDKLGRSFDEIIGEHLGARRAKKAGQVIKDTDDEILVRYDDGEEDHIELYRDFPMNQKSGLWSRKLVKAGDRVEPNKVVAASNFTDDNGVAAGGLNAKIGVAPYKGWSMDDATPVSESFARRMVADQFKLVRQDLSDQMKMGKNHYVALLPEQFEKSKLDNLDDDGMVKPGTLLQPGDPIFLATMPKTVSSADVNLGRLSKAQRQSRRDASQTWDGNTPATVVEARKTKDGVKVILRYSKPLDKGDKIVLRQGAKATVSTVLPDDQMPRGEDGEPLDLLLNPLSLNSRANPATSYELRLANIARKMGSPMKVPAYLPKGTSWRQYVADLEKQHGVSSKQRIYDPVADRELDNPITVGYGFVKRLHHTSESKSSARGIGSYDQNELPSKGGGDNAQAKRYSGLENTASMSAGAYAFIRGNATIRGQKQHDFWQSIREGKTPRPPSRPFVFDKFLHLLQGAGINPRDKKDGRLKLAPWTDDDLESNNPVEIENGELVDLRTFEARPGGLFDQRLVDGNRWGRIRLPRPVINPAMEESVRVLLGMTKKDLEAVLDGSQDLPDELVQKVLAKRRASGITGA